jgi:hypothetical protein
VLIHQEALMTWELLGIFVVIAVIAAFGFAYMRSRRPGGG